MAKKGLLQPGTASYHESQTDFPLSFCLIPSLCVYIFTLHVSLSITAMQEIMKSSTCPVAGASATTLQHVQGLLSYSVLPVPDAVHLWSRAVVLLRSLDGV